jgi:hypothetical protein
MFKMTAMHIRISLIIALTIGYSLNSYGQVYNKQNTYLDALELEKFKNNGDKDAFEKILDKYGGNNRLCDNPFFQDPKFGICMPIIVMSVVPSYEKNNSTTRGTANEKSAPSPKRYSASLEAASWQASAINGIANFMAGRFKQEVLHAAINQVFKQIKTKEDSILVKTIFPKTFKQIGNLYGSGSSAYYTTDLLLLRQITQLDIELLPKNLIKSAAVIFPKMKNEERDMLSLGSYIYEYSQQERSLDRMMTLLATETYSKDSKVQKILHIADLISQALINEEGSKDMWVNPVNVLPVKENTLNDKKIRYFYGLLYQQLIEIPEFKEYLLASIGGKENVMNVNSNDLLRIATDIQNLVRFVNNLNNTYEYIRSKEFKINSPEEAATYIMDINKSIAVFGTSLSKIPDLKESFGLNDTILDFSNKYLTIVEALMKKDYQRMIPLLVIEFGDYMRGGGTATSRTILFVSQLAVIESADDMEALLNAYALPIGSSSIKRHSDFNMSLNGYVGITNGWETAYGSQINQMKGNIGLAAPIGVSATFCKGYLTSFLSFIDLGSIVNLRLNNDTFSYSSLKFEHFFSPGIGLFLNCPKLPISAGLHFNYIPNLRTIKYESGTASITESNLGVTRLNFSLLVDIPFFTIYNKAKTKY